MKVKSVDYIRGLKDGITLYAWWKGGTQHVGTCGTTLKQALEDVDKEMTSKEPKPPDWVDGTEEAI